MRNFKSIGIVIVILVIGFNVYDYFKVKNNVRKGQIEECSRKFRVTNPKINKKTADKYCECALNKLGGKYKNSNAKANVILENERSLMQDCFDEANQ